MKLFNKYRTLNFDGIDIMINTSQIKNDQVQFKNMTWDIMPDGTCCVNGDKSNWSALVYGEGHDSKNVSPQAAFGLFRT